MDEGKLDRIADQMIDATLVCVLSSLVKFYLFWHWANVSCFVAKEAKLREWESWISGWRELAEEFWRLSKTFTLEKEPTKAALTTAKRCGLFRETIPQFLCWLEEPMSEVSLVKDLMKVPLWWSESSTALKLPSDCSWKMYKYSFSCL